jgi:RHS repeat-associated protein
MLGSNFAGLTENFDSGVMYDADNRELSIVGRWLSPDPAGTGWNQYEYAGSNPNSFIDPSGLTRLPSDAMDGVSGSWFLGFSGFGNFSGGCTIDGMDASCAQAGQMLQSGTATPDLNAMANSSATGIARASSLNVGDATLFNGQVWVPTGIDGGYAPVSPVTDAYTYSSVSGNTAVGITRGSQTRTKGYDAMGRMTYNTTPESGGGTWHYYYDTSNVACSGSAKQCWQPHLCNRSKRQRNDISLRCHESTDRHRCRSHRSQYRQVGLVDQRLSRPID